MLRQRLPIGLIAPVALVILVVALGVLQYRWVGQVSERERDQLRQSLDRRARDFADDFDREVGRAYQAFRPEPGLDPGNAERFAKQYDEWQASSPFAGFVKTAYFAQASGGDFALHRYVPATRQFETAEWPASLAAVRTRLAASHVPSMPETTSPAKVIALTATPVMPTIPAIVIAETRDTPVAERRLAGSLIEQPPGATINMMVTTMSGSRNYVVLELDKDFIASTMLPALADRHFPESGADRFRMSVLGGGSNVIFRRGLQPDQTIDPAAADAATNFFGLRMEMFGFVSNTLTSANAAGNATYSAARREQVTVGAPPVLNLRAAPLRDALVITRPGR